jgi:hypothetical protein
MTTEQMRKQCTALEKQLKSKNKNPGRKHTVKGVKMNGRKRGLKFGTKEMFGEHDGFVSGELQDENYHPGAIYLKDDDLY